MVTYEWELDENGHRSGCTQTTSDFTDHFDYRCDEHGNIVEVLGADGNVITTIEYVEIKNPSRSAWINAHCITTIS